MPEEGDARRDAEDAPDDADARLEYVRKSINQEYDESSVQARTANEPDLPEQRGGPKDSSSEGEQPEAEKQVVNHQETKTTDRQEEQPVSESPVIDSGTESGQDLEADETLERLKQAINEEHDELGKSSEPATREDEGAENDATAKGPKEVMKGRETPPAEEGREGHSSQTDEKDESNLSRATGEMSGERDDFQGISEENPSDNKIDQKEGISLEAVNSVNAPEIQNQSADGGNIRKGGGSRTGNEAQPQTAPDQRQRPGGEEGHAVDVKANIRESKDDPKKSSEERGHYGKFLSDNPAVVSPIGEKAIEDLPPNPQKSLLTEGNEATRSQQHPEVGKREGASVDGPKGDKETKTTLTENPNGKFGAIAEQATGNIGEAEGEKLVDPRPERPEAFATARTEGLRIPIAIVEGNEKRLVQKPSEELPEKPLELRDIPFDVKETKGGPSHYLRLQHEHLDRFGSDSIVEARVARASSPERNFKLYTSTSYADPHLNISHLIPTHRESFRVLSLRKFEMSDFVQDFNEHKPNSFGNVTLSHSEGTITLKVDNLATTIVNPKLSARGQGPILEGGVIQGTSRGNIRIAKESDSFSLHFRDYSSNHPRIIHMKARESYIEVGILQTSNEPDYRTRRVPAISIGPAKDKPENELKNRFTEIDSSDMTKKEIRAWIDTEGNIYTNSMGGRSGPEVRVVQKYREPLDVFARSVEKEIGVPCKVKRDKRGFYYASITSNEAVAKVIREVGPFRTPQKCEQVRKFEKKLKAERMERRRVIERSKKLLDL